MTSSQTTLKKIKIKKIAVILLIIALTSLCTIVTAYPSPKVTPEFANSQHYQNYIIKNQNNLYYKTPPTRETIIDYIFTQSPRLIKSPNSKVYLNLKDHGWFLNREIIAHSRKLTSNEITKYHYPTKFTAQDTITRNLHSLPDNDILIGKTPGTDNQIGVFIDLETHNQLEPELENKFKWISTYNYNRDDSYWYTPSNGWIDTIYEPI
jgi:hypothetical protein